MSSGDIEIRINKATTDEISSHLNRCSGSFIPPLGTRTNIVDYSNKIRSKAITFEAIFGDNLEGLVAAYFNYTSGREGFITNVSVSGKFKGRGIATLLIKECIRYARLNHVERISLEVYEQNTGALRLYERMGFSRSAEKEGQITMTMEIKAERL